MVYFNGRTASTSDLGRTYMTAWLENGPPLKFRRRIFCMKTWGIFQPAMLVFDGSST